jgi:hypothetical protein
MTPRIVPEFDSQSPANLRPVKVCWTARVAVKLPSFQTIEDRVLPYNGSLRIGVRSRERIRQSMDEASLPWYGAWIPGQIFPR